MASHGRWIRLGIGIALSAGALWLAMRGVTLDALGSAFKQADWRWVPAMVGLKVLVLVIKDRRWQVELGAMAPGRYRGTFRAIGLGYFGNIVLPFKLGELLRVGLLKRHNPTVRIGDALATIAAERALDGAILAVMVGAVLHTANVPDWVFRGTVILLAVMLSVMAVSMITPLHRFFLDRLPQTGILGFGRKVIEALSHGTAVLRKPRFLAQASGYTALAWLGESLVLFCAIQALAVPIGYTGSLVVTLLLSVGLLIPSAPGQIGTHQALTVLFLGPFGVGQEIALSISFTLQAVSLATLGSIGGFVMIRESGTSELVAQVRSAQAVDEAADEAMDEAVDEAVDGPEQSKTAG